jgi:hypothetical protein
MLGKTIHRTTSCCFTPTWQGVAAEKEERQKEKGSSPFAFAPSLNAHSVQKVCRIFTR